MMKFIWFSVIATVMLGLTSGLVVGQDRPLIYNGPYVQQVTQTEAVISWETRQPGVGFVEYGLSQTYDQRTDKNALTTQEYPIPPGENVVFPYKLAPDALASGKNVLAVGVWNTSPTSDLTLIVRLDLDDTTVLDEGSPVKYVVPSKEIPGWMDPDFDDSEWLDGISGIGRDDGDDNTDVGSALSVYVRYTFDVPDASAVKALYLFVDYDDGYVAWLNGQEIHRSENVPGQIPSWNTRLTSSHEATDLPKGTPNPKRWGSKEGPKPIGTAYIHHVRLRDLQPGTTYHYRVHFGEAVSQDGRFKTAPSDPEAPFRFAVIGDGRSHPEVFRSVAQGALSEQPDFFFYVGDFVRRGTNYPEWHDQFFTPGADLLQNTPIYPVIGNHERGSSTESWYYRYMLAPTWYAFDWGPAHFIVLDSQRYGSKAQEAWLLQELERSKNARWLFVLFHYHVYSSKGRGVNMTIHNTWAPIFQKYGVDIVFSGHEHHYERSYRQGTYYIISGGGGAEIGRNQPMNLRYNPYKQIAYHINQYCTVDVYPDRIVLTSSTPEGRMADALMIPLDRPADRDPPSAVRNLRVKPGIWSATLTWDPVPDEDLIGYDVYRSDDDGEHFVKLTPLPIRETQFVDLSLMGDAYLYRVVAVDDWDNQGRRTDPVWVSPSKPRITYLSDLRPAKVEGSYRSDLTGAGTSIRLNRRVVNRGIGVSGSARLHYALGRQFREFQATVGIDQALGNAQSSVIFRVYVDGNLAYESGLMTAQSAAQQVSVPLEGAQALEIVVDDNGDSNGDEAVWAEARLLR